MADTKYSALTDVSGFPLGTLEWGVNESGTSKALSLNQVRDFQNILSAIQSDFTLAAASGVQSAFPTAQDVLTVLAATTYKMEGLYIMNTGATTHTTAMAFALGGGASVTSFEYLAELHSAAANVITTTISRTHVSGVASKVLNATSTAVWTIIRFQGLIRINAGGTITPQINFSANPTGTNLMKVGSYIRFTPMGANTLTSIGSWA